VVLDSEFTAASLEKKRRWKKMGVSIFKLGEKTPQRNNRLGTAAYVVSAKRFLLGGDTPSK